MSKKRIVGINETVTTTKAEGIMVFDIDQSDNNSVQFFNTGGYSFVLEDAEGYRVRFYYDNSGSGFFTTATSLSDFQPRYHNNDPTQSYYVFDSDNPFFGESSTNPFGFTDPYWQGTPVRINRQDLNTGQTLTVNYMNYYPDQYKVILEELVKRTVTAINYADEVKISASYTMEKEGFRGVITLKQTIAGPEGNTIIDRGQGSSIAEQNFYGILTEDIKTTNFTGGTVSAPTYENVFSERSGSLSNAIKKEINRKSFLPGILPSNKITTGKKLTRENVFFDDTLTCIFENKDNINTIFGLPITEATINGKEELFFTYSNIDESHIYDSSIDKFKNEQLLLRNSGIYSKPNKLNFEAFIKPDVVDQSEENKLIRKKMGQDSLDRFIDQKRVVEEYTPYEENFGKFTGEGSDFETFNIDNDPNYNIKNRKQIKISLDFSGEKNKNAYLVNTAIAYNDVAPPALLDDNIHYTDQINFLKGNKKAVSSKSFPTAYWNFNDNRWEYLDAKSINTAQDGFVSSNGNENFIFPANIRYKQILEIANADPLVIGYNFLDNVKNNLLNRPICFSPSFRPNLSNNSGALQSHNESFLMQPTTSHGFPQKYNWQPHENHVLKMSDYIDENFIAEKIIIKGKISANFEKPLKYGNYGSNAYSFYNFESDYPLKQLRNKYAESIDTLGFNFFILNQRKNADIINKSQTIPHSSFYVDADLAWGGMYTSLPTAWYSDDYFLRTGLYSEHAFYNNNEINSSFSDGFVYEFANKNLDFYKIDSSATNKIYIKQNKNMFYYLDETDTLASSSNRHTQFVFRDIENWNENNYNNDVISDTAFDSQNSINIFDINSSYADGVEQRDVSRELVTFSNLLFVNTVNDSYSSQTIENWYSGYKKYNNIDKILFTDSNSVSEKSFTINSNLKNYNKSNYIDESSYILISNKTNDTLIETGSLSSFEASLAFEANIFSDSFSNFASALDNKYFELELETSKLIFIFKNNTSNPEIVYKESNNKGEGQNVININYLSNSWSDSSDISLDLDRAFFNFNNFLSQLSINVFNDTVLSDLLIFANQDSGSNIFSEMKIQSTLNDKSLDSKLINIKFIGKDNDENVIPQKETTNFSGNISLSIANSIANVPDTLDIEILENNVNILEGFSKGSENLIGVSSERIINKKLTGDKKLSSANNEIDYNYYSDYHKDSIVNTEYLIKPEDEFIFGINSYGNGDLITSMVELHDNLDIIIIGRTQRDYNKQKTSESKSIRKVLDSSKERKTNIEGSYLTKNNYFSNKFNIKDFKANKRLIGSSSSNKFGTWGGFINLEEVDKSLQIDKLSRTRTFKKYFYDSILPNFVDVFININSKGYKINPIEQNIINFIIDDNIESDNITTNDTSKSKILFKSDWLNKFIFNDSESFAEYRNINNTINSSITRTLGSQIQKSTEINVNINENSYNLTNISGSSIGEYSLPYTELAHGDNYSNDSRLPLKIQNNSKYNFIKNNKNIVIDSSKLDNFQVNFSIQKPIGFQKWILVIHDSQNILRNNNWPIYLKARDYIEQNNEDFEKIKATVGSTTYNHIVSKRSIPLTLHDLKPYSLPNGDTYYLFKSFSKNFKVYFETEEIETDSGDQGVILDNINTYQDYFYPNKNRYYTELEYWEVAEIIKSFSDDMDRPENYGDSSSGFPYNENVYTQYSDFAQTNLRPTANVSKLLYDVVTNNPSNFFAKIYDLGEQIGDSGSTFFTPDINNICNVSISRYKLTNAKSIDRPVLENYLQDRYKFDEKESIINTIQTYIDKKYLEDEADKLKSVELEFDQLNTLNQDLLLNEKIYETDVYYLSPIESSENPGEMIDSGNMIKTNTKAIFKYIEDENGLLFPYIDLLSMKTKSSLLNTRFNKKDSSIFLPEKGKIRIYEQTLLDIHNETNIIVNSDIPYFDINLNKNDSNGIPFNSLKITEDELNIPTSPNNNDEFIYSQKNGSKLFTIKANNYLSENSNMFNASLFFEDNYEEWGSFDDRDRNINNFIYTFGKRHDKLPLKSCEGFKFGVFNGHKTSKSYKFNAYGYGQFADFISYSTNAAYIRENSTTRQQIIEYPVEKVFVDTFYNVVETSPNTYNKDIYSRYRYPYIENDDNELSQLHVNNPLYNSYYAF